jgi:hypothetical protein
MRLKLGTDVISLSKSPPLIRIRLSFKYLLQLFRERKKERKKRKKERHRVKKRKERKKVDNE